MKIKREASDVVPDNVVNRSFENRISQTIKRQNEIHSVSFDQIVKNEIVNIGHIFATQLGGVPETNFPAFNEFLESDPYIYSKTSAFEVSKYTHGRSALHLVKFGERQFYQIARVFKAEWYADSFLTEITLTTMTGTGSYQIAESKVDGFLCTKYRYDFETGKVLFSTLLTNDKGQLLPLSDADRRAAKLQDEKATEWDHIPVVVERPLYSTGSIVELAYPQLRDIHQISKSLYAKITASKYSWAINADALMDSNEGALQLESKLNGAADDTKTTIVVKSYDGRIGDVIVPIGVPQDFAPLLDAKIKLRYELYDILKIPDMSKQSAAKANKQDKEIVASTMNKNALLDSLRLQKERLWKERAKDWAMLNRIEVPKDLEINLETITKEDIVGVNNANTNTEKRIVPANDGGGAE